MCVFLQMCAARRDSPCTLREKASAGKLRLQGAVPSLIAVPCCSQAITQDHTGHREPIRGALYNSLFAVVVSVDDGGATCVWNLQVIMFRHVERASEACGWPTHCRNCTKVQAVWKFLSHNKHVVEDLQEVTHSMNLCSCIPGVPCKFDSS